MFVEMHRFFNLFFLNSEQLPAAKKGFKNGASQQTFGPSYFDRALALTYKIMQTPQKAVNSVTSDEWLTTS